MERVRSESRDRVHSGAISSRSARVGGAAVTEVTFDVGALWSTDIGSRTGAAFCPRPHTALILAGSLGVRMDDGSELEFASGDAMYLPPGHDVWTVGSEPCVFVEFTPDRS